MSVRGRRALMATTDEREISIVRRHLSRLGVTISEHDPAEPPPPNQAVDVILMDADSIPIKSDHATVWKGSVADHRADRNGNAQPVKVVARSAAGSFLIKPLRSAGLYTALVVAFDSAQRRVDDAAHIEKLEDRIRSRRVVLAAVLQIMRGHGMSETDAFPLIRQTAMRHRTTIEVLSAEIIAAGGMPNRTTRTA